MKLVPTDPPGRSSRKARRFAQDMRALRAQGYTFEAIRMALAAVGVNVSNATVQREVARAAKGSVVVQAVEFGRGLTGEFPSAESVHAPATPGITTKTDPRSAKEIAEAFTATQNTNPLFRPRSPE
jgi:hypothetical protein